MFMSSLLIDNCSRLYRSVVTAVAVLTVSKHWRKFKALGSSIACSCIRCIQGWIQDLQVTGYLWITVTNMWLPTVGSPLGCLKGRISWKFDKNSLKWSNREWEKHWSDTYVRKDCILSSSLHLPAAQCQQPENYAEQDHEESFFSKQRNFVKTINFLVKTYGHYVSGLARSWWMVMHKETKLNGYFHDNHGPVWLTQLPNTSSKYATGSNTTEIRTRAQQ